MGIHRKKYIKKVIDTQNNFNEQVVIELVFTILILMKKAGEY